MRHNEMLKAVEHGSWQNNRLLLQPPDTFTSTLARSLAKRPSVSWPSVSWPLLSSPLVVEGTMLVCTKLIRNDSIRMQQYAFQEGTER